MEVRDEEVLDPRELGRPESVQAAFTAVEEEPVRRRAGVEADENRVVPPWAAEDLEGEAQTAAPWWFGRTAQTWRPEVVG